MASSRPFVLRAVLAATVFDVYASQLMAAFVPPNLPPGSKYQLTFVTADSTAATSGDINYYNSFVQTEAAQNPSLPTGVTWHAVVSTLATFCYVNAPLVQPIYNTQGIPLLQDGAPGIVNYGGGFVAYSPSDQFGNPTGSPNLGNYFCVWTGTAVGGGGASGAELGQPEPFLGVFFPSAQGSHTLITFLGQAYFNEPPVPNTNLYPLIAVSDPITVPVPEPATLTLLAIGFLSLGGMRFLWWQHARRRSSPFRMLDTRSQSRLNEANLHCANQVSRTMIRSAATRTIIISTSAALILLANVSPIQSSPITYVLTSADLEGVAFGIISTPPDFLAQGTITTDGTTGMISASNIESWSWSASNGTTVYQATSAAGTIDTLVNLTATSTELYLTDAPSVQGRIDMRSNAQPWSLRFLLVQGESVTNLFIDLPFSDGVDSALQIDPNRFVIGTVVPEPTSILIALPGVVMLSVWLWQRKKGVASTGIGVGH